MAKTVDRHLYYDQQKPLEEPLDAEHAHYIKQEMFARRPPTTEDQFFLEQDRRERERRHLRLVEQHPKKTEPPADLPDSIWQRIYRSFNRRFNTSWRP